MAYDAHRDRARADSFGAVAQQYDRHRPTYPTQLLRDVLPNDQPTVLDVGAGTGIASVQLRELRAVVTAVEPDPLMAAIAIKKGVPTEIATFEQWDPMGRTYDVITFGQSFHWVDPEVGAAKAFSLLRPGGRLALMWNRFETLDPTSEELDAVYGDYLNVREQVVTPDVDPVPSALRTAGFEITTGHYSQRFGMDRDEWLDLAFTHSNHLILAPDIRIELRNRLSRLLGDRRVQIDNDALLVLGTVPRI